VRYVDDSKGTNVGATLAAVAGLQGPLLLIAGGDGKGQDFTPLAAAFRGKVRHALLIGRDAPAIAAALAMPASCALRVARSRRAGRRARRAARRHGAAVAGLRQPRHVPRLRPSRRCIRRGRAEAGSMSSAAMSAAGGARGRAEARSAADRHGAVDRAALAW
jgi:hypothetical protein